MKGEEHILVNFPIDTSLKKKAHSALMKFIQRESQIQKNIFNLMFTKLASGGLQPILNAATEG